MRMGTAEKDLIVHSKQRIMTTDAFTYHSRTTDASITKRSNINVSKQIRNWHNGVKDGLFHKSF